MKDRSYRLAMLSSWNTKKHPVKNIFIHALRFFKTQLKQRWSAAGQKEQRLLNNTEEWPISFIHLPNFATETEKIVGVLLKLLWNPVNMAILKIQWNIWKLVLTEGLVYANGVSQRSSGHTDASVTIKRIMASPKRATNIRKSISSNRKLFTERKNTSEETLSTFVETYFTSNWNASSYFPMCCCLKSFTRKINFNFLIILLHFLSGPSPDKNL